MAQRTEISQEEGRGTENISATGNDRGEGHENEK